MAHGSGVLRVVGEGSKVVLVPRPPRGAARPSSSPWTAMRSTRSATPLDLLLHASWVGRAWWDSSVARVVTWGQYQASIGDRSDLFAAVADVVPVDAALYPGSYVDLSPSTAIRSVTYVDTDARAARFFSDPDRVATDLAGRTRRGAGRHVRFLAADYTQPLDVADASMDLLVSLFAGPVWEHCRRYLRPGAWLLANSSHGDASLAALDPSLRLVAVVHHRDGHHRLTTERLEEYLVPRRPEAADAERIRASGRGIAYTRTAFAYLFRIS